MEYVQQEQAVGTATNPDYRGNRQICVYGKESVARLIGDKSILHQICSRLLRPISTYVYHGWDYTTGSPWLICCN